MGNSFEDTFGIFEEEIKRFQYFWASKCLCRHCKAFMRQTRFQKMTNSTTVGPFIFYIKL